MLFSIKLNYTFNTSAEGLKDMTNRLVGDYVCAVSKLFTVITYYFTIRKKSPKYATYGTDIKR